MAIRTLRRCLLLLLACASLGLTGCLLAVAGAAGAGAAAGYVYVNGRLYRDYRSSLTDSMTAVRAALNELQFPIINEKSETNSATIETRTVKGTPVRIYLDEVPSQIPAEKILVRIGVRVGFSGDEEISGRILDQIDRRLVPPIPAQPQAPTSAKLGAPQAIVPVSAPPRETAAPPLATPKR